MTRFLLASSFVLALASGSAFAADMSPPPPVYKAPPPPPPTWTGCYIDGGVGYGMWNQDHYAETFPGPPFTQLDLSSTTGGRGWLGRLGAGCDYQFSAFNSNYVIGAFGDYDFMGLSGNYDDPFNFVTGKENESGAWAVGARIGYLVTPTLLAYFDGGYTQTRFDQVNLFNSGTPGTGSGAPSGSAGAYLPATTYNGWFLGGGTEYAFTWLPIRGLFWRTEYRFSSFEAKDLPYLVSSSGALVDLCLEEPSPGCGQHVQKYLQTVTTSLVWRFNY